MSVHAYLPRQGLDWCRICSRDQYDPIHKEMQMSDAYPILKFFAYAHLSDELKKVAMPFAGMAVDMATTLPPSAEVSAGLRKLLEAKDCFVRAAL